MEQEKNTHGSSDWAEGPRPSFFGQLHAKPGRSAPGERHPGARRGKETKHRRARTASGADAGRSPDAEGGDTVWAEPLEKTSEADSEWFLAKEREVYVREQLNQTLSTEYWDRQLLSLATTVLIAGICWRSAPKTWLVLWVVARSLVTVVRVIGATLQRRRHDARDEARQQVHARRMVVLAALNGAVLGSSVLFFLGRLPIGLQYLCWMVLSGAVTLPIHSLALDPPRMRAFVNSLFFVLFACMMYRVATIGPDLVAEGADRHYEFWFVVLPLVQWAMVLYIAKRVQSNARKALELEFYKHALIDTLAEKRRQAEEAVQIKNRFLATAAHDMRQPVMALAIYAEHLQEVPDDRELVVPKIAKAAAAVNRLFDSLFDLARMDNEQLKLRIEPLDIAGVMQDLHNQFEPIAQARDIELRMRTVRHGLWTDPVLIRRMIGNIVANAIKYSAAGKKVLIAARLRGAELVVEVWDQGAGIAPEELSKVFLEFYKIEGSNNAEGFGLGLSIVARLAHALDTRVSVRSQLGRGTVFRLAVAQRLPGDAAQA